MRGAHLGQNRFLCRRVNQANEDCFIDHATQRNGMHACPEGTYMRGYRQDRNLLTCCFERERGYTEYASEFADTSSQEFGMHACPSPGPNTFMTGINAGQNRFLCGRTPAVPSPIDNPVYISLNPEAPRSFFDFYPGVDLDTWQRAVSNWLGRMLNLPLNRSYLSTPAITILSWARVEGGVLRQKIRYTSLVDGQLLYAYLLFPSDYPNGGPYPAALITHGHDNNAKDGTAILWDDIHHAAALYLAQNGVIALAPDTRSWGEYRPLGMNHDQYTNFLQGQTGNLGAMPQMYILDNMRSVSLLLGLSGVDPAQLYSAGLSLGGYQSLWVTALDTRIQAGIPGGIFLAEPCMNNPGMSHKCQTVPGLSRNLSDPWRDLLLETSDLAALIAPRPLYAMWGIADDFYSGSSWRACRTSAHDGARAVYNALGVGDSFLLRPIPGMAHEFDNSTAYEFFLGAPPVDQLDYGNQCNGMHCCPTGKSMAGIHVGRNTMICRDMIDPANEVCFVDTGTQRAGMHACPTGSYMRGVHVDQNRLTCCYDQTIGLQPYSSESVDFSTQAQGMHTCPADPFNLMTGIEVGRNQLLCAAP